MACGDWRGRNENAKSVQSLTLFKSQNLVTECRVKSPEENSKELRWHAHWLLTPLCCCWMNRFLHWMRTQKLALLTICAHGTRPIASPCSMSRIIMKRFSLWANMPFLLSEDRFLLRVCQ